MTGRKPPHETKSRSAGQRRRHARWWMASGLSGIVTPSRFELLTGTCGVLPHDRSREIFRWRKTKYIFYREGAKMRRIQIKKRFLVQFPDLLRVLRAFAVKKHFDFSLRTSARRQCRRRGVQPRHSRMQGNRKVLILLSWRPELMCPDERFSHLSNRSVRRPFLGNRSGRSRIGAKRSGSSWLRSMAARAWRMGWKYTFVAIQKF